MWRASMAELSFKACRQEWDTIAVLELLRQLAWEMFHNSILVPTILAQRSEVFPGDSGQSIQSLAKKCY